MRHIVIEMKIWSLNRADARLFSWHLSGRMSPIELFFSLGRLFDMKINCPCTSFSIIVWREVVLKQTNCSLTGDLCLYLQWFDDLFNDKHWRQRSNVYPSALPSDKHSVFFSLDLVIGQKTEDGNSTITFSLKKKKCWLLWEMPWQICLPLVYFVIVRSISNEINCFSRRVISREEARWIGTHSEKNLSKQMSSRVRTVYSVLSGRSSDSLKFELVCSLFRQATDRLFLK